MIFPNKSSKHAFAHIYQILQNELKTDRNSQCRYKTQRKFIFALASYVYDIRDTIKFRGQARRRVTGVRIELWGKACRCRVEQKGEESNSIRDGLCDNNEFWFMQLWIRDILIIAIGFNAIDVKAPPKSAADSRTSCH